MSVLISHETKSCFVLKTSSTNYANPDIKEGGAY